MALLQKIDTAKEFITSKAQNEIVLNKRFFTENLRTSINIFFPIIHVVLTNKSCIFDVLLSYITVHT